MQTTQKSGGFVTLTVSLILLIAVTLVTLFTVKSVSLENKMTQNAARSQAAFETAEAGMAVAMAYLANDPDVDGDDVIDPVFDTDADGQGDSTEDTFGAQNTARAVVTVTDMTGGLMSRMQVSSTGFSDDNSAQRTVSQIVAYINPLPNAPGNPMTTRGAVVINGSATVHNPEGNSTIWSGDGVDLGSNNATATNVANPGDASYPGCMDTPMTCGTVQSSNKVSIGLDVIENDASLAALTPAELFENFFGLDPATFHASMVTIDTTPGAVNTDAQTAQHEVIWVEGNANLDQVTVGCASTVTGNNVCSDQDAKPSILVVNGDASFSGTPHFYGLVFVMGSLDAASNTTIHGAVISAGDVTNSTGGSLDVWYNSDLLAGLARTGPLSGSAGTWRDFQ